MQLLFNYLFISVLQNLLFCNTKAALLHGKTHCFTSQKSRLQNVKVHLSPFHRIIFTKPKIFSNFLKQEKRKPTVLTSSGNPVF